MTSSRSPKFLALALSAVLVGAVLLVAPAAEASVARTVSIGVSPNGNLAGKAVTFSGKLSKSPKGSAVKIQRKIGTTWKLAKAGVTKTAGGAYAITVLLPTKPGVYRYRAYAPKKGNRRAAFSKVLSVVALRKTVFNRPDPTHEFVMLASPGASQAIGSLKAPFTSGAKATLQRRVGSTWTTVGTSTVGTNGIFQIPYATPENGDHRIVIARKGLNASATSITEGYVFA